MAGDLGNLGDLVVLVCLVFRSFLAFLVVQEDRASSNFRSLQPAFCSLFCYEVLAPHQRF